MPRFRFSSAPDSQIDPFNAGDPVMPGGEPDPLDETAHADSTANEPSYAPHGDKDGVAHKPSDNYRAPTTGGHSYDAPSIDVPAPAANRHSGPERWRRVKASLAREAASGKRGGSGCAIAILVFFLIFGGLGDALAGCVSTLGERVSEGLSSVSDDSAPFDESALDAYNALKEHDWREYADELDLAAADAFEQRMDALLADPSADPATGFVTSALKERLEIWVVYDSTQLGIDAQAATAWALSGLTYQISGVYAFDDGTATIYFDSKAPSLGALIDAAYDGISAYLTANDLGTWSGNPSALSDAQRAETSAIWEEALKDAKEFDESFTSIELTCVDGVWTVDEASLEEALRNSVGLY